MSHWDVPLELEHEWHDYLFGCWLPTRSVGGMAVLGQVFSAYKEFVCHEVMLPTPLRFMCRAPLLPMDSGRMPPWDASVATSSGRPRLTSDASSPTIQLTFRA